MADIIFKRSPLGEVKDYDDKSMIVSGYGSYFDNKDADGDIIRKGAYKKTIEEAISSINLKDNDIIVITGSLYLAGEVLNLN